MTEEKHCAECGGSLDENTYIKSGKRVCQKCYYCYGGSYLFWR